MVLTTKIDHRANCASALTAAVAACLFALQLLISGVALGANPASFSDGFICAQTAQSDQASEAPAAPTPRHHASCCILHHAAFDEPPVRSAIVVALTEPTTRAYIAPSFSVDSLKAAPELTLLAARAPPVPRA